MDTLLTVPQVAENLKCHPQTVYKDQELRHYATRIGGRLLWRESKLQEYIDQRTQKPPPEIPQLADIKLINLISPPAFGSMLSGGNSGMAKAKTKARYNLGYGAIYQRITKNGKIRWYIDYRDGSGKRIQKVAPLAVSKEEAAIALREEIARVFKREHGEQKPKKRIKFLEFAGIYMKNYAMLKKRSWESDQKYLNAQLIPFFGNKTLSEITPFHANQFMVKRQKDGVKNSTINRELTVLKKMLNLAIEWEFDIEANPVKKGNFFSEEEYRRDRVLSDEEEKRLFKMAALHLRPILTCALSTGMRYAEILGLTWDDVDLDNRQILIKAVASKSGRGRVVPINQMLFGELQSLKKLNNGESYSVFLYPDPGTGKLRSIKTVRKAFVNACRRAKIQNLTFHDLRHTFASRLIAWGADPVSIKNILGHSNLKTTEIYLHSSIEQMQKAVELLDEKRPKGPQKPENLLHIRYTEDKEEKEKSTNAFFSDN